MLTSSSTLRVFLGLPIPEDKALEFRKYVLKENPHIKHRGRWTRPGNHHITVRFLGNIAEQKIPILIASVSEAIKEMTTFEVKLRNISLFPSEHGKLVAVNIQPSIELQSLYNVIDLVVTTENFPSENRPYIPHITLFRLNKNCKLNLKKIFLGNEMLLLKELILYQSVSIEKGSLYVPLHKFSL